MQFKRTRRVEIFLNLAFNFVNNAIFILDGQKLPCILKSNFMFFHAEELTEPLRGIWIIIMVNRNSERNSVIWGK